MVKLNFTWVENKLQYQTGESLYLNKIRIGGYGWNSARNDDSETWAGQIELPSLKDRARRVYANNPDEIKSKIEKIVTQWFDTALKE